MKNDHLPRITRKYQPTGRKTWNDQEYYGILSPSRPWGPDHKAKYDVSVVCEKLFCHAKGRR
jgi:hypothetical protein